MAYRDGMHYCLCAAPRGSCTSLPHPGQHGSNPVGPRRKCVCEGGSHPARGRVHFLDCWLKTPGHRVHRKGFLLMAGGCGLCSVGHGQHCPPTLVLMLVPKALKRRISQSSFLILQRGTLRHRAVGPTVQRHPAGKESLGLNSESSTASPGSSFLSPGLHLLRGLWKHSEK